LPAAYVSPLFALPAPMTGGLTAATVIVALEFFHGISGA
jgi:hypothetical protein